MSAGAAAGDRGAARRARSSDRRPGPTATGTSARLPRARRRTARNDAYSRPVNTGAMNTGFQSSVRHAPQSACCARCAPTRLRRARRCRRRDVDGRIRAQPQRRAASPPATRIERAARREERRGASSSRLAAARRRTSAVSLVEHVAGVEPAAQRGVVQEEAAEFVTLPDAQSCFCRATTARAVALEIGSRPADAVARPSRVEADDDRPAPEEPRRAARGRLRRTMPPHEKPNTRTRSVGRRRLRARSVAESVADERRVLVVAVEPREVRARGRSRRARIDASNARSRSASCRTDARARRGERVDRRRATRPSATTAIARTAHGPRPASQPSAPAPAGRERERRTPPGRSTAAGRARR